MSSRRLTQVAGDGRVDGPHGGRHWGPLALPGPIRRHHDSASATVHVPADRHSSRATMGARTSAGRTSLRSDRHFRISASRSPKTLAPSRDEGGSGSSRTCFQRSPGVSRYRPGGSD
jgi:hypothetical protein